MRELLDPSRDPELALPPDDELVGDVTAVHWRVVSGGKIQVESKDDIKKRIGRSTDRGDGVVMSLWVGGVSWAEAYGFVECQGCGELSPAETGGTPVTACPSCHEPLTARQVNRQPEEGLERGTPRNPWMDVYGRHGAR